jgi:hypothetical protein
VSNTTLKGKLTISRPYGFRADENPYIRIAIEDSVSCVEFVELEVPLASFAEALTGLSGVEASMTIRGLDNVGKRRVVESVSFKLTEEYLKKNGVKTYDKGKLRELMNADPDGIFQREGWALSTYLGSQNSVSYSESGVTINTSYTTFVEIEK